MKAIIVVDLPSDLDISLEDIKTEITLSSKDETKSLLYLKYGRVKLKPMPQAKQIFFGSESEIYKNRGWNECLKEILGEEE